MRSYILTHSRFSRKREPLNALGPHQGDLNFFSASAVPNREERARVGEGRERQTERERERESERERALSSHLVIFCSLLSITNTKNYIPQEQTHTYIIY